MSAHTPTIAAQPGTGLALTALGLGLPTLLSSLTLPGLDLERWHELFGFESRLDLTFTGAALLMVPWVQAALLVHAVAWLVPAWRRAVRSARVSRNLARTAWMAGVLALLTQALGLVLYFHNEQFLVNEGWAGWLVGACMVAASLSARALAALVSRHGIGDGVSVVIAGELLLYVAEQLRRHALGSWAAQGDETGLTRLLAVGGAIALGVWLAGWITPRRGGVSRAMPPVMPSGLVPAGLAAALMALLAAPHSSGPEGIVASPWMRAQEVMFSIPLRAPLPDDGDLELSATAVLAVVVAVLATRPAKVDRILGAVNRGGARGRRWFWLATLANAGWLLLLTRAAALTSTGSLLPCSFMVAFVLHDVWMEWRLTARGQVAFVPLNTTVAARAASSQLSSCGIAHALRGQGLRSLLHGFAPFTELQLVVSASESDRAVAELAPLLEADRGR